MPEASEARSDSLTAAAGPQPLGPRLRRIATAALFAAILLIPKLLRVRRDPGTWLAFRVVLGLLGAALVVVPLGLWNSWLAAVCGLALFLTAALLGPAAPVTSLDDKARELGALVVVNSGEYVPAQGFSSAAHLFVGAENLWALDSAFAVLAAIPVAQISSVVVLASPSGSVLRIGWTGQSAEFSYRGFFAEHLARVAESTIRSVMRPSLPIIQRAAEPAARGRAAGA